MMTMASPAAISSTTPSFTSYSAGNRFEQIAARVITELAAEDPETDDLFDEGDAGEASDSEEFEFSFVCRDPDSAPIAADELFANGQIRPILPIFNSDLVFHGGGGGGGGGYPSPAAATVRLPLRKLMAAGGGGEEKPPAPEGDYCVWTPGSAPVSPERCKKSKSTGSTRRWRLRDLLHRSGSDGKDTLLFLAPAATGRSSGRQENPKAVARPAAAAKVVGGRPANSPARSPVKPMEYYIRDRAMREGDRRRSYLPYRQDIVGFFASVNGLSRPHH